MVKTSAINEIHYSAGHVETTTHKVYLCHIILKSYIC